jgi:hypothetical protein
MTSSNNTVLLSIDGTETSSNQGMGRRYDETNIDDQSSYQGMSRRYDETNIGDKHGHISPSWSIPSASPYYIGGTTAQSQTRHLQTTNTSSPSDTSSLSLPPSPSIPTSPPPPPPSIPTISFIGNGNVPFHSIGIMNVKIQQPLSDWYHDVNRDVDEKEHEDHATAVLSEMFDSLKHCITEDSHSRFQEINYRAGTAANVIKTYGFTGIPGSGWHLLQPRTRSWNAFLKFCAEVRRSNARVDGIVIDFSFPERVFKHNDSLPTEDGYTFNETYPVGTQILEIVPSNGSHKWGTIMDRMKSINADGSCAYTYDITFEKFGKLKPMNHEQISQLVVNAVNNKEAGIKKRKVRTASAPIGDTATTSHHGTSHQARMNTDILRSDDDNRHRPHDSPADPTASSGRRIERQLRQQQEELTQQPHQPSLRILFSPVEQIVTEPPSRTMQSQLIRRNNTTPTVLAPDDSQAAATASSGQRVEPQPQLTQQPLQILAFCSPLKWRVTEPHSRTMQCQFRQNNTTPTVLAPGQFASSTTTATSGLEAVQQQLLSSATTAMTGITGCQTGYGELTVRTDHPESTAMSHFTGSQTGDDGSTVRKDHPESTEFGNPTSVDWSSVSAHGKIILKECKKINKKRKVPSKAEQHNQYKMSQTSVRPHHAPPRNPRDRPVHQPSVKPHHAPPRNPWDRPFR